MNEIQKQARAIFEGAVEIADTDERMEFVQMKCENNEELLNNVLELIRANEDAYQMFGNSNLTLDNDILHRDALLPKASQEVENHINQYKLIELIGEGGMGEVWLAEQIAPIRRKVAVKLVRKDLGSKDVVTRFEAERQALAMMDHPNIASVFDAGTTAEGSPYFVMELVNEVSLTQFCDEQKMSISDRLKLFVPICKAIQHAHQKGIVHRDLKPSNVLVTEIDGSPIPKVIDFGLAKAINHNEKLTSGTLFTEFGKIVGTLQYMSPEQAELNALDIDTRTDIYSLGVLLYELLTGTTPLEKSTIGENAILRVLAMIRDTEPPRPSTRLSQSGDAVAGISSQRQIKPNRLNEILRGELDWIVMKSLEKERDRRYETASDFAADISRFLDGDTVHARPPSFSYSASKFLLKHKFIATAVASILILMSIATITTTMLLINMKLRNQATVRAESQAERADQNQLKFEQQVELIKSTFENVSSKNLGQDIVSQIGDNLTDTARLISDSEFDESLKNQQLADIAKTLAEIGAPKQALELAQTILDTQSNSEVEAGDLRIVSKLSGALSANLKFEQIVALLPAGSDILKNKSLPINERLGLLNNLAYAYQQLHKLDEALRLFDCAIDYHTRELKNVNDLELAQTAAVAMHGRASVALQIKSSEENLHSFAEACGKIEELFGESHTNTITAYRLLSQSCVGMLKFDLGLTYANKALALARKYCRSGDPLLALCYNTLVRVAGSKTSDPAFKKSLSVNLEDAHNYASKLRERFGTDHPHARALMKNIAIGYSLLGSEEEGIAIIRNEATLAKENFGENSVEYHQGLMALADSLKHFGRHREALPVL